VRAGLAGGLVTGDAASLPDVLDGWAATDPAARPALLAAARGPGHHQDHALAALARSLARPGLRDRVARHASAHAAHHAARRTAGGPADHTRTAVDRTTEEPS
jgi:hypothetical protein